MTEQQAQHPELQLPDEQQQLVEGIHIAIVDQKQNQIDTVPGPQQNMPITPNYPMQTPTTQNPSFTVQYPQDLTVMAMHKIYINDEVKFEHVFERKTPWFGSIWSEKSIFNIPGLGILSMGDEYKRHMGLFWRLMPNQNRRNRRHHDYRGSFNSHFFKVPDYIIENENIEMDYWNCIGTIIVGGIPLLQFQTTQPNSYDVVYGHCCVGFPKVILYQLLEPAKRPLIIVPDVSKCPESVLGLCGLCSLCGTCTKERFFTVEGLTQGSCTIYNKRTYSDAYAKACFLQGQKCYSHVDYPDFKVNFVNVLPVEKLAILLGLVHYNIIKKWYVIVQITRQTVGVA